MSKKRLCQIGLMLACGAFALTWSATATAKKPRAGKVKIQAMTAGIKVYIDGKLRGNTPFTKAIRIRSGSHKLKATKAGYSTMELRFKVPAGRKIDLHVDLLPFSGLVKFTTNIDGVEVYVDEHLVGHTPLIRDVVVGDHKISFVLEGYNDFTKTINVKAGQKHFIEGKVTPFTDFSPEGLAAQQEQARILALPKAPLPGPEIAAPALAPAWYNKWWVWTIAGALITTAVTVPFLLGPGDQAGSNDHIPDGVIELR